METNELDTEEKDEDEDENEELATAKLFMARETPATPRGSTTRNEDAPVEAVAAISNETIVEELSLPPVKIHCSVLAEDAIKAAVSDWKSRNGEKPSGES